MKLKNFAQLKKALEGFNFTTVETEPGKWDTITRQHVMEFIDWQQERMVVLAAAIADKLEKGELK